MHGRALLAGVAVLVGMAGLGRAADADQTPLLHASVEPTWVLDGVVDDVRIDAAGRAIVVGANEAGPPAAGALLDDETADLRLAMGTDGDIAAIVADGRGGWIVGGAFGRVRGLKRGSLVRIGADGRIDTSWPARVGGRVHALVRRGGVLFVGGRFRTANGAKRRNLAAFDVTSGRTTAWNPVANGEVLALAVARDALFAGGAFTRIGESRRAALAAFDADSGALQPWHAAAVRSAGGNAKVRALAAARGTLYVGGSFHQVGGESRRNLAAVDVRTAAVRPWSMDTDGAVHAVASNGAVLAVGGVFERIGADDLAALALFDVRGATPLRLESPRIEHRFGSPSALAFALASGVLYVGGEFDRVDGLPRSHLAAVRLPSRSVLPWNPRPNDAVRAIATSDAHIAIGGSFTATRGVALGGLAAVGRDGRPLAWGPRGEFSAPLATSQTTVFAALKDRIVAVDRRSGTVRRLRMPAFIGPLLVDRGVLVGTGIDRVHVLDLRTGERRSFGSELYAVHALAADRDHIYVAEANRILAVDRRTLRVSWHVIADDWIWDMRLRAGTLVAAGDFKTIGGAARLGIAAIDRSNGSVTRWKPRLRDWDYSVRAVAVRGNVVFVGGWGFGDSAVTAVDATTGERIDGLPRVESAVLDLRVRGHDLWLAGTLRRVGSTTVGGVAHLRLR